MQQPQYPEKPVYPGAYQNQATAPPPYPQQQYQTPVQQFAPQPQYYQQAQHQFPQSPQTVYAQQPANPQVVVLSGGCPVCRIGHPTDEFSLCGIVLAILFFPIGVLCCLAMKDRRCSHCGVHL